MRNKFLSSIALAVILTTSAYNVNATELTSTISKPTLEQKQDNHPHFNHQEHFEKMSNKLATELSLTPEQIEKFKLLRQEGHQKIEPLFNEMKELRTKMDKIRKENMEAFEKILTKEQFDKFKKIKEEGKKRHQKGKAKHKRPHFKNSSDVPPSLTQTK